MHPVERFAAFTAEQWHREATALRQRGLSVAADMAESFATDLKAHAVAWLDELLTLREAAEISRYGYSTLEHRVRTGQLPNAGEKGRPRLRRRDLPIKSDGGSADGPGNPFGDDVGHDSIDRLVEHELLAIERESGEPLEMYGE